MRCFKHTLLGVFVSTVGAFGLVGCEMGAPQGESNTPPTSESGSSSDLGQTTLALTFEAPGETETACGTAAGMRVIIENEAGESQVCEEGWVEAQVTAPYTTEGDAGLHNVADCLFVVEPGFYQVTDISVLGPDNEPLSCCTADYGNAFFVEEGQTTEFGAELSCNTIGNGAVDIYGWLNRPPNIVDLDIHPSKFLHSCTLVTVAAQAIDDEGDDIVYDWTVADTPPGANYAMQALANALWLVSESEGDYWFTVTATDSPEGLSNSLTFPLHIVHQEGPEPCDPEAVLEEALELL